MSELVVKLSYYCALVNVSFVNILLCLLLLVGSPLMLGFSCET